MFDLMPGRRRMGKGLIGFKTEMDNLFNRFFDIDFPFFQEFAKEGQWAPRVDISEDEKDITVQAEIPGCEAKDNEIIRHLLNGMPNYFSLSELGPTRC